MSAVEFVALIVGIFFLIGIWVGVIAVMALAARRRDREDRRNSAPRRRRALEEEEDDDVIGGEDDDRPQWPDNGYQT